MESEDSDYESDAPEEYHDYLEAERELRGE